MKGLILACVVTFAAAPAFAAPTIQTSYGDAGCGLGSMVFGSKGGAMQILAATTNGTFGSQSFGITFGTSNCGGLGSGGDVVRAYVEANAEILVKDAARGNGETIVALAVISGCADADAVGTRLQADYANIFPNQSMSSYDVTKNILATLRSDASLSCKKLS